MKITADFPGGNIKVVAIEGRQIVLDNELRDTTGDWFYWCCQVQFEAPGEYMFHFAQGKRVGSRGPAYSYDGGKSWQWLYPAGWNDTANFVYTATRSGEVVRFCTGMQYLQSDWSRFSAEFAEHPDFTTGMLCYSPAGRPVEMAQITAGQPPLTLLVTARHHACEMMANHAMEGLLRYALTHVEFRQKIGTIAVPFVDKDGVENGDQGKDRVPYDHGRDYFKPPIYPETRALQELIKGGKIDMVLDLHCPYLLGYPDNECSYLVGDDSDQSREMLELFGGTLERLAPFEAPFCAANNIPFGQAWNNDAAFANGWPIRKFANLQPAVKFSQTMEIPFANFGAVTIDREAMLKYGSAIAQAVEQVAQVKKWC